MPESNSIRFSIICQVIMATIQTRFQSGQLADFHFHVKTVLFSNSPHEDAKPGQTLVHFVYLHASNQCVVNFVLLLKALCRVKNLRQWYLF